MSDDVGAAFTSAEPARIDASRRTSSETNSAVFAIFVGMIARGAGIDTTNARTLEFKRLSRQQRAFDARTRRETADPRPF
jgi:cell division septum initiation protein DivIVA